VACIGCRSQPEDLQFSPLGRGEAAILFVGDILLADRATALIEAEGGDTLFDGLRPLLKSAQATALIGNQEGPITLRSKRHPPNKKWNYGAHPATSKALARAGFTHLSLANNHALDRGPAGLVETTDHLRAAGIVPFGAGSGLQQATQPALISAGRTTVAVVGTSHVWKPYRKANWGADKDHAGLSLNLDRYLVPALKRAQDTADITVVFTHWGREYKPVAPHQQREARLLFERGADVIIGHHSHEAQTFGWAEGKPVLWSLGNFAFGSMGRFKNDGGYGLVARVVLKAKQLHRIELAPILVDNERVGFRSRPLSRDRAQEVLTRLGPKGSQHFRVEGGIGILEPEPSAASSNSPPEKPGATEAR